jgi:hypothetical protein
VTTIPTVTTVSRYPQWDAIVAEQNKVAEILTRITIHKNVPKKRREAMLAELSPDTLAILSGRSEKEVRRFGPFITECVNGSSLLSLNNVATFIDCKDEAIFSRNESFDGVFLQCVAGLRMYEGDERTDYSLLSEEEQEVGRSLIRAAHVLNNNYRQIDGWKAEDPQYLRSEELVALIKRRPGDAEAIINLLKDRELKVDTPSQVRALENILDSEVVSSLGSGIL